MSLRVRLLFVSGVSFVSLKLFTLYGGTYTYFLDDHVNVHNKVLFQYQPKNGLCVLGVSIDSIPFSETCDRCMLVFHPMQSMAGRCLYSMDAPRFHDLGDGAI